MGCILYALCYFKSPFDTVYERGDSVALAVMSAHVTFPENTPYNEVIICFVFLINLSIINIINNIFNFVFQNLNLWMIYKIMKYLL